jgi:integrase/recombinase XerC
VGANFVYSDFFKSYLLEQRNYSAHTAIAYLKDVEQFMTYVNEDEELRLDGLFTTKNVKEWIRAITRQEDLAPATLHRKVSSIKTFARFLFKTERLAELPSIEVPLPKKPKALPSAVKVNELTKLFQELEKNIDDYESHLVFVMMSFFYHTGVRRSELIELKTQDVNLNKQEVKVFGKGSKERIIPFAAELKKQLSDFLIRKSNEGVESSFIFCTFGGEKLKAKWVYHTINKLLQQTFTKKKSPHALRHSFATHLLQNGASISAIKELLGHSSLSATQIYANNNIVQLKEIYGKTHPLSD